MHDFVVILLWMNTQYIYSASELVLVDQVTTSRLYQGTINTLYWKILLNCNNFVSINGKGA